MKTFAIIMAALLTINLCACSQENKTKEDKDMGTIYDYTALSNKGQEVFRRYNAALVLKHPRTKQGGLFLCCKEQRDVAHYSSSWRSLR